jgi:hypothetical protein
MELEQFAREFQAQIAAEQDGVDTPEAAEERFTLTMIDYLIEAGEIDEGVLCQYRSSGARVANAEIPGIIKTYKGRISLTFDGSAHGLRIENFVMPVFNYDPSPKPPAAFQVFPARSMAMTKRDPSRS